MTAFAVKMICALMFVFVGIINAAPSTKLPKGFVQCKLSDPAFNECIKNGLYLAYPHLAKGIPSLGLLPTDPLRITSLGMEQGSGAVKLKLKFKDLEIRNMKYLVFNFLKYDPKTYTFSWSADSSKSLILDSLYEAIGKVLVLPVNGNGKSKIILDDYKSSGTLKMKPIVKNGATYLEVQSLKWKFSTSKMHLHFENMFKGDKALEENLNVFLNENWQELLKEMQPTFEEAMSAVLESIVQQFFNRVPLNQIFLD